MTAELRCESGYFFSGVGDTPVFLSIPLVSPFSFSGVITGEAGLAFVPGNGLVPGLLVGEALGEPVGEAAGELVAAGEPVAAGDEVTAGLGLATGLFCVVFASVHAPRNAADAAKTVSRTDLLIVFTSI